MGDPVGARRRSRRRRDQSRGRLNDVEDAGRGRGARLVERGAAGERGRRGPEQADHPIVRRLGRHRRRRQRPAGSARARDHGCARRAVDRVGWIDPRVADGQCRRRHRCRRARRCRARARAERELVGLGARAGPEAPERRLRDRVRRRPALSGSDLRPGAVGRADVPAVQSLGRHRHEQEITGHPRRRPADRDRRLTVPERHCLPDPVALGAGAGATRRRLSPGTTSTTPVAGRGARLAERRAAGERRRRRPEQADHPIVRRLGRHRRGVSVRWFRPRRTTTVPAGASIGFVGSTPV